MYIFTVNFARFYCGNMYPDVSMQRLVGAYLFSFLTFVTFTTEVLKIGLHLPCFLQLDEVCFLDFEVDAMS